MKIDRNCVFSNKNNGCTRLNVKKCIGKSCTFAQSMNQAKASRKKSNERLASLEKKEQRDIANKYYGGKMPWIEGGVEE